MSKVQRIQINPSQIALSDIQEGEILTGTRSNFYQNENAVKRIQIIPSQINRPASQGEVTLTGIYSNLPYNKNVVKRLQVIIGDNFKGDLNIFDNEEGSFKILPLDELQQLLTQVLIRFDNNPDYYTKSDYQYLIWYLCQSIGHLVEQNTDLSDIINQINELVIKVENKQDRINKVHETYEKMESYVLAFNNESILGAVLLVTDDGDNNGAYIVKEVDYNSDPEAVTIIRLSEPAKITTDIVVAGGPLANDVNEQTDPWPDSWKDASGNKKIPAGTSVQTLFEKLFNQELYPNAATKPSISIDGEANLGVKEVGLTVEIPALSMGKSAGKFNASYSTPAQPATGVTWSNESITVGTPTGFTGMSTTGGSTRIAQTSGKIVEGANSVTYNASASYSAPTNRPLTNLGNTSAASTYTFPAGTAIAAAASTTATGVYAIYTSGKELSSSNTNDDAMYGAGSQNKLALANYITGTSIYVGFGSPANGTWDIYLPAGVSITSVKGYNSTTQKFDIVYTFAANGTMTIATTCAGNVTYTKYTGSGAAANNLQFTIKKL